jgi:hypothetical protein
MARFSSRTIGFSLRIKLHAFFIFGNSFHFCFHGNSALLANLIKFCHPCMYIVYL